jgi:hypothetical protein
MGQSHTGQEGEEEGEGEGDEKGADERPSLQDREEKRRDLVSN